MKKIFLITIYIAVHSFAFAQSRDTSNVFTKDYKNNIQAGIFAPAGVFALQFEHALTKRISFNTISEFNYRYYSTDKPIDYSIELMPQLRWYTQKKKRGNQGFYISLSANVVYDQSYTYGSYNPQNGDIRLNSSYIPSGYYYEDNIIRQKISIYTGAGAGYQWLISKRFIIDLGYSIQFAIFGRERFQNVPVQNEWQKIDYADAFEYLYFPFQINLGYAF